MAKRSEQYADEQPAIDLPLLTVEELAQKHGQTSKRRVADDTPYSRSHLGADAAHGWTRHGVFKSQDVRLADLDYLAALAAFDAGKLHEPANMRPQTVLSEEYMQAKYKADANKPKLKQGRIVQPGSLHADAKKRAAHVANIGKHLAKQKRGGK